MRTAKLSRKTGETDVVVDLNLDGAGKREIDTGIGFMNHMLELFAVHGGFDLTVKASGDLEVDGHHTTEDIGISLGKVIKEAFGDKRGIRRYGFFSLPMDEALAEVSLDVSGRPYLVWNASELCGEAGGFDFDLVEEFFRAVAVNAGITLHVNLRYGTNLHHMAEAVFKGFARALSAAAEIVNDRIPSSKGVLE